MNLAELQQSFRHWLVDGSAAAAASVEGAARAGLDVYQNNYRAQLVGCLRSSYPHLSAWLGEEAFLHAAAAHIARHPPQSWSLDHYGGDFRQTLVELFPDNPDLHELAWIEQALSDAFIAPDAPALDPAGLAAVDWNAAMLRFVPSLRLASLSTNACDLWQAMHDGSGHPDGEMLPEPGGVLAWRRGFTVRLRALDALGHAALAHALEDGSFAGLCEMLVERLGEQEGLQRAGALLAEWIDSELLAAIDHAHTPTCTPSKESP